ncbi:MAG: PQQ-binding-like beta-propeller repeat protein, partial [Gemmataceae bacterium]
PAVAGNRTFLAGCDSLLHIVDTTTGKAIHSVDIAGQSGATAAVDGNEAFVGTMSNQVVAVDIVNAKKLWTFEAARRQQPFYSSAAVTADRVFIGSRDKKLYALDRKTGKEVWSFTADGMIDPSPVYASGRLYVGCLSMDGNFYVLDAKNGTRIQELNLDSAVTGSVAVVGKRLWVGTEKGTLYCLGTK